MTNQLLISPEETLEDPEMELTESVLAAADQKADELDIDPQLWEALKDHIKPLRDYHPPT